MELEFDKYCVLDGSPTTVLPAPRTRPKVAHRKSSGKLKCGNDLPSINQGFAEIRFNRYLSASCKDVRPRRTDRECNDLLKRGSVYQSSKEVGLLRRPEDTVGRKKIEYPRGSASALSLGIIDSLCNSDEDSSVVERKKSSVMSISEHSTSSFCKNQEFCPKPERIASQSMSSSVVKSKRNNQPVVDLVITPESESAAAQMNDGNSSQDKNFAVDLRKSLSSKLALPHSPAQSESDGSKASSPKSRFHPVRKMLDPFVKSKSHRSPLNCAKETGSEAIRANVGPNFHEKIRKSLLNDLSDKSLQEGDNFQCEKKDNHNPIPLLSPAHLHGLLKMERKHGVPIFEFSVKSPEEVYVAKTCKVDKALSWVYTFHSLNHRRKSNASGWGFKESNKESSMIGQMHVSCYLCTELKGAGVFNDSMVTEFVLYDVAHSRRSVSSQDSSCCSPDARVAPVASDDSPSCGNSELHEASSKTRNRGQSKHSRENGHLESSSSQPLAAAELHPGLEIAAIIMQVPCEKRESLKFKSGDQKMEKPLHNLLDLCRLEEGNSGTSSPGNMHVVIPYGNHSLPSTESRGPSPLLDRWRLGGGCDCGGWDMACPLNVCANPNLQIAEGQQPLIDSQHPAQLFVQGRKNSAASFRMRAIEEGKYAVDFHAQLSSLQAFSICVAIQHAAEASTASGHERSTQMLQSDSLRVYAEEEIKCLIDTITEEEKLKTNKMEEVLPSFVLNPPFSPISRA